jgi:hypothetical protein
MELSEPVVVLVGTRHSWYLNALRSIPGLERRDVRKDRDVVHKWWRDRYGAYYTDNYELVFPNRETYLECLLTWS